MDEIKKGGDDSGKMPVDGMAENKPFNVLEYLENAGYRIPRNDDEPGDGNEGNNLPEGFDVKEYGMDNMISPVASRPNGNDVQKKERVCAFCGAPESVVSLTTYMGNTDVMICDRCAQLICDAVNERRRTLHDIMMTEQNHENPLMPKEAQPGNNSAYLEGIKSELGYGASAMPPSQSSEEVVDTDEILIPVPHAIKDYLDSYVIGQDDAKIKLAVAVYNHYKRIMQDADDTEIEKSNILLVGESGCGKTMLAKSIANMLDVPFTIVDATVFTQAGYVGEDVESILTRLLQAADYDVARAERGIVFIDEIDKVARKGDNPSITKDVSGEGVQQALLKLLEGSTVNVSPQVGRKHPEKQMIEINTSNILFICSGAFVGIEKKIGQRMNMRTVGFTKDNKARKKAEEEGLIQYLTSEDIRAYGMIPELVGRLPVITYVKSLTKPDLKRILKEPKNSLVKQYKKLMAMEGVTLRFEDSALDYIVDKAYEMKVGARALRSIIEEIMTQYMFDVPSTDKKRVTVSRKYAEKIYEAKSTLKQVADEI